MFQFVLGFMLLARLSANITDMKPVYFLSQQIIEIVDMEYIMFFWIAGSDKAL